MALEPVGLTPAILDGEEARCRPSAEGSEGNKVSRLPRWTRQEILVLIHGKRMAENRVPGGRASGVTGSDCIQPKWAAVSSHCMRHGVNRGPVQCRKRWSNLLGDFKKIKEWETKVGDGRESFWLMRNDLRREEKLPGVFDREVYDILNDGSSGGREEELDGGLTLAPLPVGAEEGGAKEVEAEALFDSRRRATVDDGFSDFEKPGQEDPGGSSTQGKETPVNVKPAPTPVSGEKENVSEAEIQDTWEGRKRKRTTTNKEKETTDLQRQMLEAVGRNGNLLSSQFEAQKSHLQLDKEQHRDQVNGLITVLNKLADALGRIADKL